MDAAAAQKQLPRLNADPFAAGKQLGEDLLGLLIAGIVKPGIDQCAVGHVEIQIRAHQPVPRQTGQRVLAPVHAVRLLPCNDQRAGQRDLVDASRTISYCG